MNRQQIKAFLLFILGLLVIFTGISLTVVVQICRSQPQRQDCERDPRFLGLGIVLLAIGFAISCITLVWYYFPGRVRPLVAPDIYREFDIDSDGAHLITV